MSNQVASGRRTPKLLIAAGALLFALSCIGFLANAVSGPGPRLIASLNTPTPSPTATPLPNQDQDGRPDSTDPCPNLADAALSDLDGDGWGDACDDDIDGDGLANTADPCPFSATEPCAGSPGVTVNLPNPAAVQDAASAGVSLISLTTFEHSASALPVLLNGVVHSASSDRLWSDAGDFTLAISFEIPPADESGEGFRVNGGSITLACPANRGGACGGRLRLTLSAANIGELVCPVNDARCAWALNAAVGGEELNNVWGAFDPDSNEVRFGTGLPIPPGDVFTTRYTVEARLSDGTAPAFESLAPAIALPLTYSDGEGDCVNADDAPVECPLFGDLRSAAIDFQWQDGAPYAIITLETAAEIPLDRRGQYSVLDVYVYTAQEGADSLLFNIYDFLPGPDGGWRIRRFVTSADGSLQAADVPAGVSITVEGSTAAIRLPLNFAPPQTLILHSVGVRTLVGTQTQSRDAIRNDRSTAPDLLSFMYQAQEGAPPLVRAPQYDLGDAPFHGFIVLPFPTP